jgi:hypothetical protein
MFNPADGEQAAPPQYRWTKWLLPCFRVVSTFRVSHGCTFSILPGGIRVAAAMASVAATAVRPSARMLGVKRDGSGLCAAVSSRTL